MGEEGDPEDPPDTENVARCTVWVGEGACQDNADCEEEEKEPQRIPQKQNSNLSD